MRSILLIDDEKGSLRELKSAIRQSLPESEAELREWVPQKDDKEAPWDQLDKLVSADTVLVVTDHDLTKGQQGLLGGSIVQWCQKKALPAALFTRGSFAELPEVPDLFALKVPVHEQNSGETIASLFRGFRDIEAAVRELIKDTTLRSPAAVLSHVLGEPPLENDFAQYAVRLGAAGGALIDRLAKTAPSDANPSAPSQLERERVLSYVVGHLLVNAVIRYPGPLLPIDALCGYIGTTIEEADALAALFQTAVYVGPFAGTDRIFWRHRIDALIETNLISDSNELTFRRRAVESMLKGRALAIHRCSRCPGINGGFYCPFTKRAVCERDDCSVGSNSWLPVGATVCRIEREFFEEWAPLLGF